MVKLDSGAVDADASHAEVCDSDILSCGKLKVVECRLFESPKLSVGNRKLELSGFAANLSYSFGNREAVELSYSLNLCYSGVVAFESYKNVYLAVVDVGSDLCGLYVTVLRNVLPIQTVCQIPVQRV